VALRSRSSGHRDIRVDLEENVATVTFTVEITIFDEEGKFYIGRGDYIVKRNGKYYLVSEDNDNGEEELTPEETKKLIEDVLAEEIEEGLLP
jgi:hypothetical protein